MQILFYLKLIKALQIDRQKTGDRLANGSTCGNGTYVMKENVTQPIECVNYMYQTSIC